MQTSVNSTMISHLEWQDGTLTITWAKTGSTTDYPNVPEEVFHEFVKADSVGGYYHSSFKTKYKP
jgi:hypothetical protein